MWRSGIPTETLTFGRGFDLGSGIPGNGKWRGGTYTMHTILHDRAIILRIIHDLILSLVLLRTYYLRLTFAHLLHLLDLVRTARDLIPSCLSDHVLLSFSIRFTNRRLSFGITFSNPSSACLGLRRTRPLPLPLRRWRWGFILAPIRVLSGFVSRVRLLSSRLPSRLLLRCRLRCRLRCCLRLGGRLGRLGIIDLESRLLAGSFVSCYGLSSLEGCRAHIRRWEVTRDRNS
ncbi:unnamed protein product [Periconia digitata]|uniref:Uncharacterized protein n=1 Tax=Periconia digitata TaxID=1303443 RepID=A0A9W4UUJ1_9PLEO|nr:unnamed protein product [Periconia digitata]